MVSSEKVTGLVLEESGQEVIRLWEKQEDDSWTSVVYLRSPEQQMPGSLIGTVYGVGEGSKRRFRHSEQGEDEQGTKTAKASIAALVESVTGQEPKEQAKKEKKPKRKTSRKKTATQNA